jgi:hypothetical protein
MIYAKWFFSGLYIYKILLFLQIIIQQLWSLNDHTSPHYLFEFFDHNNNNNTDNALSLILH